MSQFEQHVIRCTIPQDNDISTKIFPRAFVSSPRAYVSSQKGRRSASTQTYTKFSLKN